ncbi:MAG: hypothetical protein IJC84_04380 [Clostridia bacterium]|nr:hypothetical protein [Clostridia bacterium]
MQQILESLSVVFISPFRDSTAGLLWCVYLAVVAALVYTLIRRGRLKKLVLALQDKGAVSPETALSEEQLAIPLPDEKSLRQEKLVAVTENDDGDPCYYLPAERQEKIASLFKAGETRLLPVLGGLVGLYALLVAAYYLIPMILNGFSGL